MLHDVIPEPLIRVLELTTGLSLNRRTRYTYTDIDRLYWRVGYALQISREELELLITPGPLPPKFRYRHFTIPKRDGSPRHLVEPGVRLKATQRRILDMWLNRKYPHEAAIGYREGMSIADHAWAHAGARLIITADIRDFFPSTRAHRVYWFWRGMGHLDDDAARFMTRLTTYRGSLPQGAPTSPALSNLVNKRMDKQLTDRTRQAGGVYTRYADDLVFSWQGVPRPPANFEMAVRATLRAHGYTLHPHKGWNMWHRRDEPEVTGLILTKRGEVDVPDSMKRLIREMKRKGDEHEGFRLAGYEAYRAMVRRGR